jgi:hypothetical protein
MVNFISDFDSDIIIRKYYITQFMNVKGFRYVGEGRHRFVYLSKNRRYVLKFPLDGNGLIANAEEAEIYSLFKNKVKDKRIVEGADYAPCRLINNCVLMMFAIEEDFGFTGYDKLKDLPKWVFDIENTQVGYYKNKLVAYDYSNL